MNWNKPCRYCGCKLILDKTIYSSAAKNNSYLCKKCSKLYCKKYHIERKKILTTLRINGCAICGYNECADALDFHHVNPKDKCFGINMEGLKKHNDVNFINELNKCILLCCNCHRKIHSEGLHE